jgi:LacI family transcriptional regulator
MPRTTLKDIALEAGVSVRAVSMVVNDQPGVSDATRQRIRGLIQHHRYFPSASARAMRGGMTRTLGLLYPGTPGGRLPPSGYLEEVLNGVASTANDLGYHILLHSLSLDAEPERVLDLEREGRVDALITVVSDLQEAHMALLERSSVPVVSIQRDTPGATVLRADNRGGTRSAVEYLARRGHQKIAYLGGPLSLYAGLERFEGYHEGLASSGLPEDSALIHHLSNSSMMIQREPPIPLELAEALEVSLSLLSRPERPSAIVCFSDLRAIGALRAARTLNLRVPEDVAVIGFNDFALAPLTDPPLTTVHFPAFEMGRRAGELAVLRISGETLESREHVLPVHLVVRSSA